MIRKYFYGEKRWFLTPFFSLHAIDWTCGNIYISGRMKGKKWVFFMQFQEKIGKMQFYSTFLQFKNIDKLKII
jgi:hypothetical protein